MRDADVLVVGSGASAVHAAWALCERGLGVLMVDAGDDAPAAPAVPESDFLSLRRGDDEQWRYFLGESLEGVPFGKVGVGAQLTPPRRFVARLAERLLPFASATFSPMQSLALGGLGAAWGAVAVPWIDEEIRGFPVTRADLDPHYARVVQRIGVCGAKDDDLVPFLGEMPGLMPPARLDSNGRSILRRYRAVKAGLNAGGFHLGAPRIAMCTRRHRGRGPVRYRDMEFWSDADEAVYRPRFTVREMHAKFPGFRREGGLLALSFAETPGGVALECRPVDGGETVRFSARRLVLAAGTFGTARIVARSLGLFGRRLPMVCNPYTYYPCVNLNGLGRPAADRRHSLTQLAMIYDPDGTKERMVHPQLYSYRSLLLFKLIKESPLDVRDSRLLMQALCDHFTIVGIHHEDRPADGKHLVVHDDPASPAGRIDFTYRESEAESRHRLACERRLCGFLRTLRNIPLKAIRPGHGSSIHYGGTFPMSSKDGDALTTTPDGELRAAPRVVVADGSLLPHLPAKGLTLTLMANADRVGSALARETVGT